MKALRMLIDELHCGEPTHASCSFILPSPNGYGTGLRIRNSAGSSPAGKAVRETSAENQCRVQNFDNSDDRVARTRRPVGVYLALECCGRLTAQDA